MLEDHLVIFLYLTGGSRAPVETGRLLYLLTMARPG